jgi:hypothetical protein
MLDKLFSFVIKNDFVRAQILAFVRHGVTAAGAGLVAKGVIDNNILQDAAGLAVTLVGFWLAHQDVKTVDQKITTALNTEPPVKLEPTGNITPEQEVEETRRLNQQLRHGLGK